MMGNFNQAVWRTARGLLKDPLYKGPPRASSASASPPVVEVGRCWRTPHDWTDDHEDDDPTGGESGTFNMFEAFPTSFQPPVKESPTAVFRPHVVCSSISLVSFHSLINYPVLLIPDGFLVSCDVVDLNQRLSEFQFTELQTIKV